MPGGGTYGVAGGRIYFDPVAGCTGSAVQVTYRFADANGTTTTSTYTPTVRVAGSSGTGPGPLAATGANLRPLMCTALTTITFGLVLLVAGTRRRTA